MWKLSLTHPSHKMFVCLWLCSDNCPCACQYLVGKIGGERALTLATMSAHLIFCSFVLFCSLSYTAVWPIWLEILCSPETCLNSLGTVFSCDGNLQFRKFLREKFWMVSKEKCCLIGLRLWGSQVATHFILCQELNTRLAQWNLSLLCTHVQEQLQPDFLDAWMCIP